MRLKFLIPFLIFLAACSAPLTGSPSGNDVGQPTSDNGPTQIPVTVPATIPATVPASVPVPVLPVLPPIAAVSEPLVLTIISPLDNDVVGESQINLIGTVSRDAVLTVNNDIYILPPGDFTIPLTLDEGPNALEIVASDADGNEIDLILTVTYQP